MKRYSIHIKIGFLLMMAVILISAAGYLSYRNLSSIVSSIDVDTNPELRLISIRDITMDLDRAQNSIRIYTITDDSIALRPYMRIVSRLDDKMDKLRSECINDSLMLQQTETINTLIEKNILIWNEIIFLHNNQKGIDFLRDLSGRLSSGPDERLQADKGNLKRVYVRNDNSRINEKELMSDLQDIELQDRITKEKIKIREAELARTGSEIKEQFYDLIGKIESDIYALIRKKADAADKLANETYYWLAIFTASATLLAIMVVFFVVRFVKKTHAYQIALQNSKDEAEKLTKTKELFMTNMSHEIRTPVTAISGFTEQLLHEKFDEGTTQTLKIIKSSSDHLVNIINDILDFSRLQNGKLELEKVHFSIRQILEDVYALFERQTQRNNTKLGYLLSPDTPPILLGDPYRLKQILINLVSNSVKFTNNGQIHFSVKGIEKTPEEIELELECVDTGIGIDESKIDLIFEDFTQEEMSTTRKYGGTGLGLSIVKKLVELHNGKIICKSRKNHGTRITCFLPYLIGDESNVKTDVVRPLVIPEEITSLKILVVDDEKYNRQLFGMILTRWKVEYMEAASGDEALDILKTNRFNLVFMDARMPGIDGLKTTELIRGDLNISESEMPVICISAAGSNEDLQKYQKAGMNAFLPKPFTEEMLLTTIISVFKDNIPAGIIKPVSELKNEPVTSGIINLQNLYHISGGDEQFVKQMLDSFILTTKKGLEELKESITEAQWDKVSELAHKLMSPCHSIGAMNLYKLLVTIEKGAANEKDGSQMEALIEKSVKEFNDISEHLHRHIANIG